ncbi:MAG: hypothetical protein FWC90_06110 [Oscillospiraceae bacterium]|nr:hypothetical protein [Oscillospiraceae bacterium]
MNTPLKKARMMLIITSVVMLISAINMIALGFGWLQIVIFCATIVVFRSHLTQYRAARKEDEDTP